MKKILILSIIALNTFGAKVIYTDKKTDTRNSTDQKYITYKGAKHKAFGMQDKIGLFDGTLDIDTIASVTNMTRNPMILTYDGAEKNKSSVFYKDADAEKHLQAIFRSFRVSASRYFMEANQDRFYVSVISNGNPFILPAGIISSSVIDPIANRHFIGMHSLYFGNIVNEITGGPAYSKRFYEKNYTDNLNLYIQAMDNFRRKSYITKNSGNAATNLVSFNDTTMKFMMFGEEAQKLMRSEKIYVTNSNCGYGNQENEIINTEDNDKIFAEWSTFAGPFGEAREKNAAESSVCRMSFTEGEINNFPAYSRANAVMANGQISARNDREIETGTSYAAPRVAGVAARLQEIFPGITYHQIKQIILTTAYREKDQLDNRKGWGVMQDWKAKKGPGALNTGLIEEEKFFTGRYDKVIGRKYNEADVAFFWADVQDTWNWENDIYGNLAQVPGGKSTYNLAVNTYSYEKDKENKSFHNFGIIENVSIANFIPSEANFYEETSKYKPGLRKAGKGTLNISGSLLYKGYTEVLDGTLNFTGKRIAGDIGVFEGGKLNLGKSGQATSIYSLEALGGALNFYGNVSIDRMYFTDKTQFNTESSERVYIRTAYFASEAERDEKMAKLRNMPKVVIESTQINKNMKNDESFYVNETKVMDLPKEYFLSDFGDEITSYDAYGYMYDKMVDRYVSFYEIIKDPKQKDYKNYIQDYLIGYDKSRNEFLVDIDKDSDPFYKSSFFYANTVSFTPERLDNKNERWYYTKTFENARQRLGVQNE